MRIEAILFPIVRYINSDWRFRNKYIAVPNDKNNFMQDFQLFLQKRLDKDIVANLKIALKKTPYPMKFESYIDEEKEQLFMESNNHTNSTLLIAAADYITKGE